MVNPEKIPLYFIGFGDFALELLADWDSFQIAQTHQFAGFFDDDPSKSTDKTYLGMVKDALKLASGTAVVLAATSPAFRKGWCQHAAHYLSYPNLIHQRTRLGSEVRMGKGNIISEGCILTTEIELGDFNALNHYVTIGHHCKIGSGNALMTKAHLSGRCSIGDHNLLGVGSSILQGKSMGNDSILAPHACLMHHAGDKQRLMGMPALGQNID